MKSAAPVLAQQTAIVIGASMAGLLAAAALAPLCRQVLVLERDDLQDRESPRKGVPQAAHVHGFLAAGCAALERLLPGIVEQVVEEGGVVGDMLQDARFYVGRTQRFAAGASGIRGAGGQPPVVGKGRGTGRWRAAECGNPLGRRGERASV